MLDNETKQEKIKLLPGFTNLGNNLIHMTKDGETTNVSGAIELMDLIATADGDGMTLLVKYKNIKGEQHEAKIPYRYMATPATMGQLKETMLGWGFHIENDKLFKRYFRENAPKSNILLTTTTGWIGKEAFIVNNGIYCSKNGDRVILDSSIKGIVSRVKTTEQAVKGTLEDWQQNILEPLVDNDLLLFGVLFAFMPPLMEPCNIHTGATFHLVGETGDGKTSALKLSATVIGQPDEITGSWRATSNALEGLAAQSNHLPMYLDEIHECSKDIGDSIYMLANGQGKHRANTSGDIRENKRWKTAVLSSGEIGFKEVLTKHHVKDAIQGGQEIRFIEIPVDAGVGMGIVNVVPDGYDDVGQYMRHMVDISSKFYGTPMSAYIKYLVEHLERTLLDMFLKYHSEMSLMLAGLDNKTAPRVIGMFAAVYAAGMIANRAKVVNVSQKRMKDAVKNVYLSHTKHRDGSRTTDGCLTKQQDNVVEKLFEWMGAANDGGYNQHIWNNVNKYDERNERIRGIWGCKTNANDTGLVEIRLKCGFLKKIFYGITQNDVIKALDAAGLLVEPGLVNDRDITATKHIYKRSIKQNKTRCICLNAAAVWGDGKDDDEGDENDAFVV